MATKVYKEETITLQDGTEVTLRPLVIARLRRFQDAWEQIGDLKPEEDSDGFDVFINCCGIALEHEFKDKFDVKPEPEEKAAGEFIGAKYKEHLADTLDLDTIYKILFVCGDIDYPKLMEMAMEAQMRMQENQE